MNLLNITMKDGSRHFFSLPESTSFLDLRRFLEKHDEITVTDYVTDHVTEVWIDFDFRKHHFSVNNQSGQYWFFVADPTCPDKALLELSSYCTSFIPDVPSTEHAPQNSPVTRQDLFVSQTRDCPSPPTPKQLEAEVCCGSGRWLFVFLTFVGMCLVLLLYFVPSSTDDLPLNLQRRTWIIIVITISLFYASLAVVNWVYHFRRKR